MVHNEKLAFIRVWMWNNGICLNTGIYVLRVISVRFDVVFAKEKSLESLLCSNKPILYLYTYVHPSNLYIWSRSCVCLLLCVFRMCSWTILPIPNLAWIFGSSYRTKPKHNGTSFFFCITALHKNLNNSAQCGSMVEVVGPLDRPRCSQQMSGEDSVSKYRYFSEIEEIDVAIQNGILRWEPERSNCEC